uniref:EB domain-containing protein n=1 Tax=Macrostomum lignano TaxID=282301 RepID=A0A1I8GJE7_9PLAT
VGYISGPGSCPQYVCQPNFCPAPAICPANQSPNYVTVSNGCVSVTCGNTRSCQGVPTCRSGETPQVTGTDSRGCTRYVCYRMGCPNPPTCPVNQLVTVTGYDASNCAVYTCQNDNGCQDPITCLASETQLYIGQDSNGCPEYLCHPTGCTPPPSCTIGERLVTTGVNGNCPIYRCQSSTRSCPVRPNCPGGQTPNVVAYDSSSCPVYSCPNNGGTFCTQQVPNCPNGQTPISSGTDANGCPVYVCQFTSRSCPFPPVCSDGRAVAEPECQYQQLRIRSQEAQADGQVCSHYTCISLGDYDGRPPKCHDNPTYCDISQTVETYVQHGSRKPCQRVVCKASSAYDGILGF